MFIMSDLSIELLSTEKLYTFPSKDTSLDSVALSPLEIFQRQIVKEIRGSIVQIVNKV